MQKKKKKNKKTQKPISAKEIQKHTEGVVLDKGIRGVKDLFTPPSFDRSNHYHMRVGDLFARSFVLEGYPSSVSVGFLDEIINYDGDMDTAIHISPADERVALDEISAKITQFEAQLDVETRKGSNRNITRLRNIISELYHQREKIEQNLESIFQIQVASTLYTETEEELTKESKKLENKLKGRKIMHEPVYLRQDDAYKTTLPLGKSYLPDKFRNFNTGALTAMFPFYNSEISHETGVLCGINLQTATPLLIDFYDRSLLNNSNLTVFGKAGSGKTFFVSKLTLRSVLKGIRTTIIDPEGEYKKITDAVNGSYIQISPSSGMFINPFDIEEEIESDGTKILNIKEKVADILNLIGVMASGMSPEQRSVVSYVIADVYEEFGFNEDPESLYEQLDTFDSESGEYQYSKVKKQMPTFSDFHDKLEIVAEEEGNKSLISLANTLRIYKKGGVYDLFDNHTSPELQNFKDSPIVTFDISALEENILRPIGMYIALSWTWEKFAKKNPQQKKRVVVDEAWMLVNENMEGHEYTAKFLENTARRIRKRNGGLLVASQNFVEFQSSNEGRAVLTNATVNIFLKQDSTDIDDLQNTFKLSNGEKNFLLSAKRGEMLIRMNEESSIAYSMAFDYEYQLITNPYNIINQETN